MANRRRFSGRATVRRVNEWQFATGVPTALISIASGAQAVIGTVAIAEGASAPGTLVRVRGVVHLEIATETAAAVLQGFGVGLGLFDDRALAVSSSVGVGLPEPVGDADDQKWMWIDYGFIGQGPDLAGAVTAESDGTGRRISVDIHVDSKAMRKWHENQTLVWLVQNSPIDGTATEIDAVVMARMLLKLP